MNVLIVGGGGREHALVATLAGQRGEKVEIFVAPGSPGMASLAHCVDIASDQIGALCAFAKDRNIGLTVVGPEIPLSLGIVDRFQAEGLRIFGPSAGAAQIETSKAFAKSLMRSVGVPTAEAEIVSLVHARERIESLPYPSVLKADGLAAGKGVVITHDPKEAAEGLDALSGMGDASARIIIERYLTGVEASLFVLTDGKHAIPLATAQDHKRLYDGDRGPNTGGMGAISPSPHMTSTILTDVMARIVYPTLDGLAARGTPYLGILYVGLMLTSEGPFVLEFNARWGDPEAQAVLPRLKTDWIEAMEATLSVSLDQTALSWEEKAAVCVVLASEGYPGHYRQGDIITGLSNTGNDPHKETMIFHAGTRLREGQWVTHGGRVLGVTALGETIELARETAYHSVARIHFPGMHYRKDIGVLERPTSLATGP